MKWTMSLDPPPKEGDQCPCVSRPDAPPGSPKLRDAALPDCDYCDGHGIVLSDEARAVDRSRRRGEEAVDHPAHYGGADNPYEAIKVIDAWGLGFSLGNTVKYISRAGKKPGAQTLEDLRKALWYLQHEISRIEEE